MSTPNEPLYYGLLIYANEEDGLVMSGETEWTGWADDDHRIELRQGRANYLEYHLERFGRMGLEASIVTSVEGLLRFWNLGGAAIVRQDLAEEHFAKFIEAKPTSGDDRSGFTSISTTIAQAVRRAPSPKLRMQVLKRDNYRCKICGRSPNDDVDVQLHVHHVKPWGERGVTDRGGHGATIPGTQYLSLCHARGSQLSIVSL